MMIWLLCHGYGKWLWVTDAWIGLLSNDRYGSFSAKGITYREGQDCHSACDYVARYYAGEYSKEEFQI